MSHTDDFRPKIVQPDGTPVDKSLKACAVVDFTEIYGSFHRFHHKCLSQHHPKSGQNRDEAMVFVDEP